jgi:hypothetical protein
MKNRITTTDDNLKKLHKAIELKVAKTIFFVGACIGLFTFIFKIFNLL